MNKSVEICLHSRTVSSFSLRQSWADRDGRVATRPSVLPFCTCQGLGWEEDGSWGAGKGQAAVGCGRGQAEGDLQGDARSGGDWQGEEDFEIGAEVGQDWGGEHLQEPQHSWLLAAGDRHQERWNHWRHLQGWGHRVLLPVGQEEEEAEPDDNHSGGT